MTNKLDDGHICFQEEFCLEGNIKNIFEKIYSIGLYGTKIILEKIESNKMLEFIHQNDGKATFFKRLKPEQSEITIDELKNRPALWLNNKIRMLTDPYPNAYIVCADNRKLFINSSYLDGA